MISAALLALALLFFPTLVQSGLHETVTEAVGAFPEDLLETFGLSQLPDFTDYTYYLTWVLQIVFLIGCLYAAWLGAVSMVKLESDDTLLMIYAQPVWRCGIVISRLLCRATLLLIYQAVLFFLTQSLGGELVMDPALAAGCCGFSLLFIWLSCCIYASAPCFRCFWGMFLMRRLRPLVCC